jgi:ElaB/YqjD/DUF883 family membrane-anchored ribosome-binding protein
VISSAAWSTSGIRLRRAESDSGTPQAERLLETTYEGAQDKMPQLKEEAQAVSERTQKAASQAKEKVQDELDKPASAPAPGGMHRDERVA